ncbi:DNA helicase [Tanacetum coccineum]
MSTPNFVIKGKTIVLGGDFRQTLPVKKGASKEELIAASITKSHLWPYFKVCTLKENMWLLRSGLTSEQQRRLEQFAKWLLDVGNGEIGEPDSENGQDSYWVTISPEYRVIADEAGMSELIDFIYDDTTLKAPIAGSLTKPYQQTLENQITLRFGKITVFEPLPGKESEFPDHHFKLISYHQLPSRVKVDISDSNRSALYMRRHNHKCPRKYKELEIGNTHRAAECSKAFCGKLRREGLTLIFATLEDLDLGLLGDVISENDCGDDGEDENVFIIGERCNLGWMNIVKITRPRDV